MVLNTKKDVFEKVKDKVKEKEFYKLVDEKMEAMAGICDELSASLLVASDLGVQLSSIGSIIETNVPAGSIKGQSKLKEEESDELIPIAQIKAGMGHVCFRGVILSIQEPRTFNRKDGSSGVLANITLGDETGKIKATVWDKKVEELDQFQVGSTIEVLHVYTREGYQGGVDVNIGYRGVLKLSEVESKYTPSTTKIGEIPETGVVTVKGVVTGIDGVREFTKKDGSGVGRLCGVWISDDTGRIKVTFWNEYADMAEAATIGDTITIVDAKSRVGFKGDLELSASGGFI